jgi:hypothetical protein
MTLTVDSQRLPCESLGFQTLGDVLSHIKSSNRLVTQVLIDGQAPDLSSVATLRARRLTDHTIFIETSAPNEIAGEVLDEIDRQMQTADIARLAAVDHLAAGEPNEALKKLSGCFTTWQAAQQAIGQVAQLLKIDLDLVRVGDVSLGQSLATFADQLRGVRDALQRRDYVMLSDTLAYEMEPTICQWRGALSQLRQSIVN